MARFVRKWASVIHAGVVGGTGLATAYGFDTSGRETSAIMTAVTLIVGAIVQVDAGRNGNGR